MELLDMITSHVPIDDLAELSKVNPVFKSLCGDKCISLDLLLIQNHNNEVQRTHDRLERIHEDINSAYDINRLAYLDVQLMCHNEESLEEIFNVFDEKEPFNLYKILNLRDDIEAQLKYTIRYLIEFNKGSISLF